MDHGKDVKVPAALTRLERRFGEWRRVRKQGERIPKALWNDAAKLASDCGLNRTSDVLKLDYYSLKKRVEELIEPRCSPEFVELPSVPVNAPSECVIELEDGRGASLRIHLKGPVTPDVLSLSRSFWNAD